MSRSSKQRPVSGRRVDPVELVTRVCAHYGEPDHLGTIPRAMGRRGIAQGGPGCGRPGHPDRIALMRKALVRELVKVFGIAKKIIYMTFADLLIASDPERPRWRETGGSMVAVDTLVHNFLHRTGIHFRYGLGHAFGSTRYGPNGCERILDELAPTIDSRQVNSAFPAHFPRVIE